MNSMVDDYIGKQQSPQKEICLRLRQIITGVFPGIMEKMKWGVPVFGNDKFYIAALKTHVNLGFSMEGLSTEEKALFAGSGKTMKLIEIHSPAKIDEPRIISLLKMVMEK